MERMSTSLPSLTSHSLSQFAEHPNQMDPPNRPKLIDRDAEASDSASFLTPTDWRRQIDTLENLVATLKQALTEEEGKRKKLFLEYKDLESLHDSQMKLHLDQISTLREDNTRLLMEKNAMLSKITKGGSLLTQIEEILRK